MWVSDAREGFGVLTLGDGSSYRGEWKNGARCGPGTFTNARGETFTGVWNGKQLGEGKCTLRDGVVYEGTLKDLLPDGWGTVHTKRD